MRAPLCFVYASFLHGHTADQSCWKEGKPKRKPVEGPKDWRRTFENVIPKHTTKADSYMPVPAKIYSKKSTKGEHFVQILHYKGDFKGQCQPLSITNLFHNNTAETLSSRDVYWKESGDTIYITIQRCQYDILPYIVILRVRLYVVSFK